MHVGFLVEWQRNLIGTLTARGGDAARPEEILVTLIECRHRFTELARQAARDLDFVDRYSR